MGSAVRLIASLGLAALAASADAADKDSETGCLSSGDLQEVVTSRAVVGSREVIGLARRSVPDAEVMRASLCRDGGALVYLVTLLQRDGRLVRVTIDAQAGSVKQIE